MFYDIGHLQEQIRYFGLDDVSHIITQLTKPSILMTTIPIHDDKIEIGVSKLGGNPDLPANHQWSYIKNVPLTLIAQFRLSDIPSIESVQSDWKQLPLFDFASIPSIQPDLVSEPLASLPQNGMLYFFADNITHKYGDKDSWQILYIPEGENLIRTPPPSYDIKEEMQQFQVLQSHKISFHKCLSLADSFDLPAYQLKKFSYELETRYWGLRSDNYPSPNHHLYGNPRLIQGSIEYACVFNSLDIKRHKVGERYEYRDRKGKIVSLEEEADKWQFLFQIDTDPSLNVMWGDMGTLYVCIPKTSLKERKFEDCIVIMQCG